MSITVLSKPYTGYEWNAVYNQMPFVFSSTQRKRPNFRYLMKIYKGSGTTNLLATLKHQPDILTGYGIFDVSKILQNVVAFDPAIITSPGVSYSEKNSSRWNCTVQEEFSRQARVTSAVTGAAPYAANWALVFGEGHSLRVNDWVILKIDQQNHPQYAQLNNKTFRVVSITSTGITINAPKTTTIPFTGTVFEGEACYGPRVYTDANGVKRFSYLMNINGSNPTTYRVGDTVDFEPFYNFPSVLKGSMGQSTIVEITSYTELANTYTLIKTDKVAPADWTNLLGTNWSLFNYSNRLEPVGYSNAIDNPLIINAAIPYKQFPTFNWSTYRLSGSTTKFLTNSPRTLKMRPDGRHTLAYNSYQPIPGAPNIAKIIVTSTSGTTTIDAPLPQLVSSQIRQDYQVGMDYFSTFGAWPSGTVSKYTVQFFQDLTPYSEIFTFNVDRSCQEWDTYRFVWLNRWGGWDYYEYTGKPLEEASINKLEYNRRLQSLKPNNKWTYSLGDRGDVIYDVNAVDAVKTWSGYVNHETANWLQELYTSPTVYIIDTHDNLTPIKVLDSSFAKPQKNKIGLTNLPIEFQYTYEINIQRGGEPATL